MVDICFSGSSNSMPPVSSQGGPISTSGNASSSGPVGPDGFDESSQQSTLSQSSDRSDGGRQTPKGPQQGALPHSNQQQPQHPHNYMPGNYPPGSPHSSAPSPGGSMGSSGAGPDGGYPRDGMASPSWQRPPASPVSAGQVRYWNIFGIFVECLTFHYGCVFLDLMARGISTHFSVSL